MNIDSDLHRFQMENIDNQNNEARKSLRQVESWLTHFHIYDDPDINQIAKNVANSALKKAKNWAGSWVGKKPTFDLKSKLRIPKGVVSLVESDQKKVNEIYSNIIFLNDTISKNKNVDCNLLRKLYKEEKKFAKQLSKFLEHKNSLCIMMKNDISSLSSVERNDIMEQVAQQLDTEVECCKSQLVSIKEQIKDYKENIKNVEGRISELKLKKRQFSVHTEKFTQEIYSIIDQYKLEHHFHRDSVREFIADFPVTPRLKSLEDELQNKVDQIKFQEEELYKMIESENISNFSSSLHLEKEVKKKILELLTDQKDLEVNFGLINREKQNIIAKRFLNGEMEEEEFKKRQKDFTDEGRGILESVKRLGGMIDARKKEYFDQYSSIQQLSSSPILKEISAFKEVESWSFTEWGRLLAEKRKGDSFLSTFESVFSNLKQSRRNLKVDLERIPSTDLKKREALQEKIEEITALICHTYLQRIIDVIGEKQLKIHDENTSQREEMLLRLDVEILNAKYEKIFEKYSALCEKPKSFLKKTSDAMKSFVSALLTFGYSSSRLLSPAEIHAKKNDADLGYDMKKNLMEWMGELKTTSGHRKFDHVIKEEVMKFLAWAETHPNTAMGMVSDICQICSIIGDKDLMDTVISRMRAKVYANAFISGWGVLPEKDSANRKDQLRYRALADLCRYAPTVAAVVKGTFGTGFESIQQTVFNVLKETIKTQATQIAVNFVSNRYAQSALYILNLARGDEFKKFIDDRKNIELVQLAGAGLRVALSPKSIFSPIKLQLRVWVKTVKMSVKLERVARIVTQIAPMVFSVIAIAALATIAALGGPITWVIVGSVTVTLIGASAGAAVRVNKFFNDYFPAYKKVLQMDASERLQKDMQDKRDEIQNEVHKIRREFIYVLQKNHSLPPSSFVSSDVFIALDSQTQALYQQRVEELANKSKLNLNRSVEQNSPEKARDCVNIFNEEIEKAMENVRNLVDTDEGGEAKANRLKNYLAGEIVKKLIKGWLQPQLDLIFTKIVLKTWEENQKIIRENGEDEGQKIIEDRMFELEKSMDSRNEKKFFEDKAKKDGVEIFLD